MPTNRMAPPKRPPTRSNRANHPSPPPAQARARTCPLRAGKFRISPQKRPPGESVPLAQSRRPEKFRLSLATCAAAASARVLNTCSSKSPRKDHPVQDRQSRPHGRPPGLSRPERIWPHRLRARLPKPSSSIAEIRVRVAHCRAYLPHCSIRRPRRFEANVDSFDRFRRILWKKSETEDRRKLRDCPSRVVCAEF